MFHQYEFVEKPMFQFVQGCFIILLYFSINPKSMDTEKDAKKEADSKDG